MDATFIIDQDYDTFHSAWDDLKKIQSFVNPAKAASVESLRFTLGGKEAKARLQTLPAPDQTGWHFSGDPSEPYLQQAARQQAILSRMNLHCRMTCDPLGKADAIELRSDPPAAAFVSIPFEDKVQNAPRYFGRFRSPLAAAAEISEAKLDLLLQTFYAHCEKHLKEETPFEAKVKSGISLFGKKGVDFIWVPKHGTVGRHEIFTELRISHPENDITALGRLLASLGQLGRTSPVRLYFQFFAKANQAPQIELSDEFLFEMTFQYGRLGFAEAEKMTKDLKITDTFSIFEQRGAQLQNCLATYTLRKTATRGYEIRVNTIWDSSNPIDPEAAVLPLEQKTGLTFARIV